MPYTSKSFYVPHRRESGVLYFERDADKPVVFWRERVSMALTPEEQARKTIDEAFHNAGWDVQDMDHVNRPCCARCGDS